MKRYETASGGSKSQQRSASRAGVIPGLILPSLILLGLLVGCGKEQRPPNVVIVTIDTCRADHLGAYGYELIETPNIDRLAANGTLFEHAFTPVPITLPSHTTIMSGNYPQFHGVRDNDMFVSDETLTLAEILSTQGYATGAFVSAYPLHQQFNLAQGFDVYDDDFESDDWRFMNRPFHEQFFFDERTADGTTHAARQWLEGVEEDRPFFLWVHYFDPHANYQPPAPFDQIYADRPYDGEIAAVDRALGRLVDELESGGHWEETIFVLTADHGEGLNDHEELTHALLLYDSTLHVPLIFRVPDRAPSRLAETVRTLDIAPTVLDLLGIQPRGSMQGTSLRPLIEGTSSIPELGVYHESFYAYSKFGWSPLRAYREGGEKVIDAHRPELYGWRQDLKEVDDQSLEAGERVEELRQRLYRTLRQTRSDRPPQTQSLDAETRAKLESLGYLGSSSAVADLDFDRAPIISPSPMDMMPVWSRYNRVKSLIREKRPPWHVVQADLRRLEELDEGSGEYRTYLEALVYLATQRFDSAQELLEELRAQGGADYASLLELAALKLKIGEASEAREILLEAVPQRPREPLIYFYLGWAAERLGNPERAETDYRQALEFDPQHSQTLMNLGNLLSAQERFAEAAALLSRAAAGTPYRAEVHYNLGVLNLKQGELVPAREFFARAVKIDPRYARAHHAMAEVLETLGEPEEGRLHLRRILIDSDADEAMRKEARRRLEATP